MGSLNVYALEATLDLAKPDEVDVDLDSPALSLFTDFRHDRPQFVESHTPISTAAEDMRHKHVGIELVVDDEQHLIGLIELAELSGPAVMVKAYSGYDPKLLEVRDMMLPRKDLVALDFKQLEHATVADVLKALSGYQKEFCLVIDHDKKCICGLLNIGDVVRKKKLQAVPLSRLNKTHSSKYSTQAVES